MSKKIRILVVDDVPESRDSVSKLLRFEPDMEVVGAAGEGREAVQKVLQLHPDVVLMDINMPDMDGITAAGLISQQAPNSAVIMMSVQNEADYLRRSMQAGAREFLVKPFSLDDLVRSIRDVFENRRIVAQPAVTAVLREPTSGEEARGQVVCFFSPKGGTGRSTLAANAAVATKLKTGKRVALVDGDFVFGDLAVLLNLPVTKTIGDLSANIRQLDEDLLADVMITHSSGIKVLLSPPSPQQAENVTADHVRQIVQTMVNSFDYVYIDMPASFEERSLAIMDMADTIMLVLLNELTSLKNARLFLEVAELLGYPKDKIRLVLNRATAPSAVTVASVAENLRRPVEAQISDDPRIVIKSVNDGVPFVISAPESKVTKDIQQLLNIVEPEQVAEAAEAAGADAKAAPGIRRILSLGRTR